MGLLLLTPEILSLPFTLNTMPLCPGLIPILHSTICLIAGSAEHFSPHQLKSSHGGFLYFKERTFFNSVMTSNKPKMDWYNILCLNYGHNVTFNFDYTLPWFNDYFAAHKKVNGSISGAFLPGVYQIWDEVIWLTPKNGCPPNAPICREQRKPTPEVSQQLNYNH